MKHLLWITSLFLTVLPRTMEPRAADTPPNFVFILVDDFGWRDLGCYGSTFYKTPHIDQLASQGARFTDAYAACPVCSPTRASILTGKYPARLQLTDWLPGRRDMPSQKLLRPEFKQQLPLEEVTLAEALKPLGYVSANIGKWHLGGARFGPRDQGFNVNIGGDHTGTPASYVYPFKNARVNMPNLENGQPGEYLTDRLAQEAESFIEANKDKPFFLYLPHFAVHIPLVAKQELTAKYLSHDRTGQTQTNAIYAAMIESLDESVGRILKKLEALDLARRTYVFFTADNGGLHVKEGPNTPATSNAPLRAGKGYLFEGGIRVPLIVRGPGIASTTSTVPVSSIDFFPTIAELAGLKIPNELDGVSLVGLLKTGTAPKRDALFWHYPHYSNQGGKPGAAIRIGDFKLIQDYEDGQLSLFNLKDDISEQTDLAGQMPKKATELHARLDAWRRLVGAQMPMPNPDYKLAPATNISAAAQTAGKIIPQSADGNVLLHARDVRIHGTTVRYEPQPHKNTIGYWTRVEDWVSWDFEVSKPGKFSVEILQGCGQGSGGSEVDFVIGTQKLSMKVQETGGFQNFVERTLGTVTLDKTGAHKLEVRPRTKPGIAVMDLRSVTLKRVGD
jgi:arylsulfatase A